MDRPLVLTVTPGANGTASTPTIVDAEAAVARSQAALEAYIRGPLVEAMTEVFSLHLLADLAEARASTIKQGEG